MSERASIQAVLLCQPAGSCSLVLVLTNQLPHPTPLQFHLPLLPPCFLYLHVYTGRISTETASCLNILLCWLRRSSSQSSSLAQYLALRDSRAFCRVLDQTVTHWGIQLSLLARDLGRIQKSLRPPRSLTNCCV